MIADRPPMVAVWCPARPALCARLGRQHRRRHRIVLRWRREAGPYRSWLDRTGNCESGSAGGYRLQTTGNGFWFRYQFTAQTWQGAGGRTLAGIPVGRWRERVPRPAEQDHRAIVVLRMQGTGAWPVCGR